MLATAAQVLLGKIYLSFQVNVYPVGGDWNMTFLFPYIGNHHPNIDELIFFRGVQTTNQLHTYGQSPFL